MAAHPGSKAACCDVIPQAWRCSRLAAIHPYVSPASICRWHLSLLITRGCLAARQAAPNWLTSTIRSCHDATCQERTRLPCCAAETPMYTQNAEIHASHNKQTSKHAPPHHRHAHHAVYQQGGEPCASMNDVGTRHTVAQGELVLSCRWPRLTPTRRHHTRTRTHTHSDTHTHTN